MTDIAQEIAELRKLSLPDLIARYEAVLGKPPRVKHSREWLWKRIAWKLQEQKYGGLSGAAKRRLEELISEIDLPLGEQRRTVSGRLERPRAAGIAATPVGTTIVREWRGRQISLKVVEGGFELDGVVLKSLSAAVRALTGAHWNGKLFWGLTSRKRSKESK